jgi:hypothetical protein
MLPLQSEQRERRPRVNPAGSPHLVIEQPRDRGMVSYEDYENLLPAEEDLAPYGPDHPTQKSTVWYWNPIAPGVYIKPWPQLAAFHDQNGMCVCTNAAEEDAWRAYLAQYSGGNPDKWKGDTGDYEFECETCHFTTRNAVAWTDHVRAWKHK